MLLSFALLGFHHYANPGCNSGNLLPSFLPSSWTVTVAYPQLWTRRATLSPCEFHGLSGLVYGPGFWQQFGGATPEALLLAAGGPFFLIFGFPFSLFLGRPLSQILGILFANALE